MKRGGIMDYLKKKALLIPMGVMGIMFGTDACFGEDGKLAKEPVATERMAAGSFAETSAGLYSKYVWRGFELSRDSLVVQPSVTVGYKGLSANFWSNLDTDLHEELRTSGSSRFNLNETDLTLAYAWSPGLTNFSAGYIYYGLDGATDSQELFLSLGLDVFLSPALTVYREIAHAPAWYFNLNVSRSVPLTDSIDLNLGAGVGYLDDTDAGNFHDGLISASISYPVTQLITVTPELYYSFALSSQAKDLIKEEAVSGKSDFIFGGVSVSYSF
jgi:hypothetical protein